MITIQHVYTTNTTILFDHDFCVSLCDTMDDVSEFACDKMVEHNFHHADVIDAETGEVLMIIERE